MFLFGEVPLNPDPSLGSKINKEMPQVIFKVNRGYKDSVKLHGKSDIWKVLPPYFQEMRNELSEITDPVISFLRNSTELDFGPDKQMPMDDLCNHFGTYCSSAGFRQPRWQEDTYSNAFSQCVPPLTIRVLEDTIYNGRHYSHAKFVMGVTGSKACSLDFQQPTDTQQLAQ